MVNFRQFSNYIHRLRKRVHQDINLGISKRAMPIINDFVNDIFDRIVGETSKLVEKNNQKTLDYWDIHIATKLVLGGAEFELTKHATSSGIKAVKRYYQSKGRRMKTYFSF